MENSIVLSAQDNVKKKEFIYTFYLHPVSWYEESLYREDALTRAAEYTFQVLENTSIAEIASTLDAHRDEIHAIDKGNIPIFSSLNDVDRVPVIVTANAGCDYEMVGYQFNKHASSEAQRKYGETHYKTAALMKLVAPEKPCQTTYLGKQYISLSDEEKDIIRPRLILLVPIIQQYAVMNLHGMVEGMAILRQYLPESSAVRRRSSIKQLLRDVYRADGDADIVEQNFEWK